MVAKRWQLELRELGSDRVLYAATVQASHWMDAVRKVRSSTGRPAELPESANYRFGAKGSVTVTIEAEQLTMVASMVAGDQEAPKRRVRRQTAVYAEAEVNGTLANMDVGERATAAYPELGLDPQTEPPQAASPTDAVIARLGQAAQEGWRIRTAAGVAPSEAQPVGLVRVLWEADSAPGLPKLCEALEKLAQCAVSATPEGINILLELGFLFADAKDLDPLVALRVKSWRATYEWLLRGSRRALSDAGT